MNKLRLIILAILLAGASILVILLYKAKKTPPLSSTFTPLFQVFGKSTRYLNIAVTKVLPIDQVDEKEYGDELAKYYSRGADTISADYIYLNKLITTLSAYAKKPFHYRIFLIKYDDPNAFALPGGVICVTSGLLRNMKTEGEVVSVICHEMGHIENGHCLADVKFEILFKKIKLQTLGELGDFTMNFFLNHTYSKNQENEADEYGYQLLLQTRYDPAQFSGAFRQLEKYETDSLKMQTHKHADIIRDYVMSHPPLVLRISEFSEKARVWWDENNGEKRYAGAENLKKRTPFSQLSYPFEWITGYKAD